MVTDFVPVTSERASLWMARSCVSFLSMKFFVPFLREQVEKNNSGLSTLAGIEVGDGGGGGAGVSL